MDSRVAMDNILVISSAFSEGESIPTRYTCDGENVSPLLRWGNVPQKANGLALICEDPDAPSGTFVHWILFDIPVGQLELPENVPNVPVLATGAKQGKNGFGQIGYGGPCPPRGETHRYFFRVYALDAKLDVLPGIAKEEFIQFLEPHIMTAGYVMGTYKRR